MKLTKAQFSSLSSLNGDKYKSGAALSYLDMASNSLHELKAAGFVEVRKGICGRMSAFITTAGRAALAQGGE